MIEDGDTDEFNEAIKGFDIKSYEDLQVKTCLLTFDKLTILNNVYTIISKTTL